MILSFYISNQGLWKVARGLKENSRVAYHKTFFEIENQYVSGAQSAEYLRNFIKENLN